MSPVPTPEQSQRLHGFGLSEYQSQAYVSLLELGDADARAVAGQGKVPLGKVYAVLEQLEQKGFVRKTAERPRRFRAVAMADVVDAARLEHLRRAEELEAEKASLAGLFPVAAEPVAADDRGTVMLLRGRKNLAERLRAIASGGRQDILYMAPAGVHRRRSMAAILANASAAGARVRVLAPMPQDGLQADFPPEIEVRLRSRGAEASGILVADGELALLMHFIPDDDSPDRAKDVGVLVEERALVQALRGLLEGAWQAAADGYDGGTVTLRRPGVRQTVQA